MSAECSSEGSLECSLETESHITCDFASDTCSEVSATRSASPDSHMASPSVSENFTGLNPKDGSDGHPGSENCAMKSSSSIGDDDTVEQDLFREFNLDHCLKGADEIENWD